MHIVIDDTYGPEIETGSKYVTQSRRTHAAVVLEDKQIDQIRFELKTLLSTANAAYGKSAKEFHFAHIYNRKHDWSDLQVDAVLHIFTCFSTLFDRYCWPIELQTVDERTLTDHGITSVSDKIDGLNLSKRPDLSLYMLCMKIKTKYNSKDSPLTLIVDEGKAKPNRPFGRNIFKGWESSFTGRYDSSSNEPLLQIADFAAFCINRSTHLSMKSNRSDIDRALLKIISNANFQCNDLKSLTLPSDFGVDMFDKFHAIDRMGKGLEGILGSKFEWSQGAVLGPGRFSKRK
uniref:DUF3800 domain-containing protein n=1 Tax=Methylobacterium sp. B34 TaxID=95563 RepID=UPI000FE13E49|nr:DUF3800 domain-containing protein [Methylobacterium sp. B34]